MTDSPAPRSWFARHKIATGVGGLLALTIVFGSCGGNDAAPKDTVAAASPSPTAASPRPTPSPKPKAVKNPLKTSANKTACQASRREVGKQADVFSGLAEGTATVAEGEKAARQLQRDTGDAASYAEGAIRVELLALSKTYGRMKVALDTGDLVTLSAAVKAQNTGLAELGRLCSGIGE